MRKPSRTEVDRRPWEPRRWGSHIGWRVWDAESLLPTPYYKFRESIRDQEWRHPVPFPALYAEFVSAGRGRP